MCLSIRSSFHKAITNLKKYGKDRYFLIKYEDLVSSTKKRMKEISKFLNIEFTDELCIPTENLKAGMANSMYKRSRVQGIVKDQSVNYKWISELTEKEKKIVISILFSDSINMGYNNWNKIYIKNHKIIFSFILRKIIEILSKTDLPKKLIKIFLKYTKITN